MLLNGHYAKGERQQRRNRECYLEVEQTGWQTQRSLKLRELAFEQKQKEVVGSHVSKEAGGADSHCESRANNVPTGGNPRSSKEGR